MERSLPRTLRIGDWFVNPLSGEIALPVAEIARSLRVSYVLDGSVRKSGDTLRVAARLVRADDGYVVWSETYDRPVDDKLMVQDEIAGEVTSALSRGISPGSAPMLRRPSVTTSID